MTKKVVRYVSQKWFEKTVYTTEECPECKTPTTVLVSVGTMITCPTCHITTVYEYIEEKR